MRFRKLLKYGPSIADILCQKNNIGLHNLLPLSMVRTKEDIAKYVQHGYCVGMTADEFSDKYGILFVVCLLVVLRVLPYGVAFAAVLICIFLADHPTLGRVDYSLILTFVALFIFIGNLGRIDAFSGWLQNILTGREVLVSVLASQVTSNVPAAILLSGFTDNYRSLIIGTNLGGLGTLIASMASLISYRQIANEVPAEKGHYFVMFTISNVVFLAILMGAWALS